MDDNEGQQLDLEAQERLALDCLMVCHKNGLEGTADELAGLLGVSRQWKQEKTQLQRKAA